MSRKNLLLSIFVSIGLFTFAQQSIPAAQVPADIKSYIQMSYPTASNVSWEQEAGYFIAVCKINRIPTKVLIDAKGAVVQTSTQIASSALPSLATRYISAHYSGQSIADAQQLTTFNKSTRYEAVVGTSDLLFDASGNFQRVVSGPLKQ